MKNKIIALFTFLMVLAPFIYKYSVDAQDVHLSSKEFLNYETLDVYNHPEAYIGYQAVFSPNRGNAEFINRELTQKVSVNYEDIFAEGVYVSGENIPVLITGYILDESNNLWLEIGEVEGYPLSEAIKQNPFVWYNRSLDNANLIIMPKKGTFTSETGMVEFKTKAEATARFISLPYDILRDLIVDVQYVAVQTGDQFYKIDASLLTADLLKENYDASIDYSKYVYVQDIYIVQILARVTTAYESLLNAQTKQEYEEIYASIPEEIKEQFNSLHLGKLEEHENSFVPDEVQEIYQQLISSTTSTQYEEIYNSLSEEIVEKLEEFFGTELENHLNELIRLDNIEYSETVMINGRPTEISVKGRIPEGADLVVGEVSLDTLQNEGFDLSKMNDLVFFADIKIMYEGKEWQPDGDKYIELTIGVDSEQYPDGTILQLYHKHKDVIYKNDVFVVMNGKITCYTLGFSLYVVDNTSDTTSAERYQSNSTITLEVGGEKVYYANVTTGYNTKGTWSVDDPNGAIYYTVHTSVTGDLGKDGVFAPWIEVVALKATPANDPVILTYKGTNGVTESYKLEVITPKAPKGQKALYIKDLVNSTGTITLAVVNENGVELTGALDGAKITWSRKDGARDIFITPQAYSTDYRSVNIAVDHAGLVESRRNENAQDDGGFDLVTYTASVILSDGTPLSANYTVYYQSEILNADFESIPAKYQDFSFFMNGYPGLYWKTTAPGFDNNISRDIEVADVSGNRNSEGFGVTRAADYATGGVQFAELNAEDFGALYQDIITAPHEDINWEFSHAPRQDESWAEKISNAMYLVIGPTEYAQQLDKDDLIELGKAAEKAGANNNNFKTGKASVSVVYEKVTYQVWYHDSGTIDRYGNATNGGPSSAIYGSAQSNYGWTNLKGTYTVPEDQYRTRLFFVSKPSTNTRSLNAGNLIDQAAAGQYKTYLIEYYEETYDKGVLKTNYLSTIEYRDENNVLRSVKGDQEGEALVYGHVELVNLELLITRAHDYLHKILINGKNLAYDIRYKGDDSAYVYVQNYPGTATVPANTGNTRTNYNGIDIVVQIFVRDTVIGIKKDVRLPNAMTPSQKINVMNGNGNGYQTKNTIYSLNSAGNKVYLEGVNEDKSPITNDISIKQPGPTGEYTGYVSHDNNPTLKQTYYVEESNVSNLVGLELTGVKMTTTLYKYGVGSKVLETVYYYQKTGQKIEDIPILFAPSELANNSKTVYIAPGQMPVSDGMYLSPSVDNQPDSGYKIAEVEITNAYVEKETIIHYKAIGNGKLKWVGGTEFVDVPTETIPYYSGQAIGAAVFAGTGARFVGWFLDEACTQPVQSINGVIGTDNSFKPNANIISADEVTFYAKFETNTIVIERENAEPGQTFVYHVQGTGGSTNEKLDIYVTVTCDETGKGKTQISEILNTNVTVTEMDDWSWRYNNPPNATRLPSQGGTFTSSVNKFTFTFTENNASKFLEEYWINAYADIRKNISVPKKTNNEQER